MIPLNLKLRRKMHRELAYAQDIIVEEIYRYFPKAIIHGGTAIWRCYKGNRFSEDIDLYINKDREQINALFENLRRKGFSILKKRIKENSLYSELKLDSTAVRVEAVFKDIKDFILKEYETSESFFINVYTLSPEDLIAEKVNAYLKRKKIRDLYDVYFLLRYATKEKVAEAIRKLIKSFTKPEDEENLGNLIISGLVPSSEEILNYLRRWHKL